MNTLQMDIPLSVGETVLVHVSEACRSRCIGLVQYIGERNAHDNTQFVGINLVEPIENGHDGTINGIEYFKARQGHGIYIGISHIIKRITSSELSMKMQYIIILFKKRLNQYISALSERDDYIKELKATVQELKSQLNSKHSFMHYSAHLSNDAFLHSINELATSPPPLDKSDEEALYRNYNKQLQQKRKKKRKRKTRMYRKEYVEIEKHSEYTKYKDHRRKKQSESTSTSTGTNQDSSSNEDESSNDEDEDESSNDEDEDDEDTFYFASQRNEMEQYEPALPIEHISIPLSPAHTLPMSIAMSSQSLHTTPHRTPHTAPLITPYPPSSISPYHSPHIYSPCRSRAPSPCYDISLTQPPKLHYVQSAPQPIHEEIPQNQYIPKKRRSLQSIKPTLELRDINTNRSRRSSSVDMGYKIENIELKNRVINMTNLMK